MKVVIERDHFLDFYHLYPAEPTAMLRSAANVTES